jgi:hypothetical protein
VFVIFSDPLAPLWPFLGILAEAIVVFLIILASECYKKRNQNETGKTKTFSANIIQYFCVL